MHKEKLKTDLNGNRSILDRGTSRPENVSAKQRKQYAHNACVACWEQSPRVTDNGPLTGN
jgi:hypothetical protein